MSYVDTRTKGFPMKRMGAHVMFWKNDAYKDRVLLLYLFATFLLEMATVIYCCDWNLGVQAEKLIITSFKNVCLKGTKKDIT
jgi:hypothetical protein